jgi:PAS domain S-box-containing protein
VLIVEDVEHDAELIVSEIERAGYSVVFERVQTAETLRVALTRAPWDVVLSDYTMPGFNALAALALLQETGRDLPFIIISGTIGEDTAVAALKAGAHDFLVKERLARLVPAIEREMQDVVNRSERRRAEEALRISEAQYRSLVEHAVFGIYQATVDGHFLTVNPTLVKMLGYDSTTELLDVGLGHVYVDPGVRVDLGRRSREIGQVAGEVVMWRRKNGDEIRVRLNGRLTDERLTGQPVFEVIVEDVTEQHRLQEQLRQAQKMEAIGQLAGGVAHDFNNMLTAILGYTELLTDQIGPDKPIGEDLHQIKSAAERAAGLTRQLLAFSRKQVLALTPVNLSQVVDTLLPMLRRLIDAPIGITTELADDLRPVLADATQLEHLLINLCVNARDAMPQGGTITLATRNVDLDQRDVTAQPGAKPGSFATLRVTDTGVGMAPEVQAKIFEPFFTTKELGRGTGLGLAAVYGTVKQLDGYIQVESEIGRGSTFTIYLPRTDQAVDRRTPGVAISPVGHETVLLVEDEMSVRRFVKVTLERFGYRVLVAESAEAALALVESDDGPIDLLLTDVVLPAMDGRELARRIARARPHTRLLFMSGYSDRLSTIEGFLEPGVQLLEKPFNGQALLAKIREQLGTALEHL